jgi:hypothetical protein
VTDREDWDEARWSMEPPDLRPGYRPLTDEQEAFRRRHLSGSPKADGPRRRYVRSVNGALVEVLGNPRGLQHTTADGFGDLDRQPLAGTSGDQATPYLDPDDSQHENVALGTSDATTVTKARGRTQP